jgi:hypothetical protein
MTLLNTLRAPLVMASLIALLGLGPGCDSPWSSPVGPSLVTPLIVTGVSPSMGVSSGGTIVQISGVGLARGARVTFGGVAAAIDGWSPKGDILFATTGGHGVGTVDVVVTNPGGQTGRLDRAFTYGAAAPIVITDISANSGPTSGGTYLEISGTGFQRGTTVSIDGSAVRAYYVTSTEVRFLTAPHAAGTVELVVSTMDGQTELLAGGFTFVPPRFTNFNGTWDGRLGDETETAFSFTVENDVLVGVSCDATALAASSAPSTRGGGFAMGTTGHGSMTGGLLEPGRAEGTISLVGCTTYDTGWFATRR